MNNLYFGVCIAPYRVDFCNYLYDNCNFMIYHQYRYLGKNYDMDDIYAKCKFEERYIKIDKAYNKPYPVGLKKLIDNNKPQIIIVPEFSLLTIFVLFLKFIFNYRFKVISLCDDSYDMICGNDFSKTHRIARKIIPYFLDNLILDNKKTVEWYQNKFGKGLYFPIIADEVRLREEYKKSLPLSNKLNNEYCLVGQKVILFVGRLIPLKNVSTLIRAYSHIKDQARLVIIGKGECEEELRLLDKQLNTDIIFTGFKQGEELYAWYNIADVFVLPSTQEAFGAVTNEALIAGCFCLVSDKAGSNTLIEDGYNGYIINPYSESDMLDKLGIYLLNNRKEKEILLKRNMMQSFFSHYISSLFNSIKKI
jgi:Glycosyltransferase